MDPIQDCMWCKNKQFVTKDEFNHLSGPIIPNIVFDRYRCFRCAPKGVALVHDPLDQWWVIERGQAIQCHPQECQVFQSKFTQKNNLIELIKIVFAFIWEVIVWYFYDFFALFGYRREDQLGSSGRDYI